MWEAFGRLLVWRPHESSRFMKAQLLVAAVLIQFHAAALGIGSCGRLVTWRPQQREMIHCHMEVVSKQSSMR